MLDTSRSREHKAWVGLGDNVAERHLGQAEALALRQLLSPLAALEVAGAAASAHFLGVRRCVRAAKGRCVARSEQWIQDDALLWEQRGQRKARALLLDYTERVG